MIQTRTDIIFDFHYLSITPYRDPYRFKRHGHENTDSDKGRIHPFDLPFCVSLEGPGDEEGLLCCEQPLSMRSEVECLGFDVSPDTERSGPRDRQMDGDPAEDERKWGLLGLHQRGLLHVRCVAEEGDRLQISEEGALRPRQTRQTRRLDLSHQPPVPRWGTQCNLRLLEGLRQEDRSDTEPHREGQENNGQVRGVGPQEHLYHLQAQAAGSSENPTHDRGGS